MPHLAKKRRLAVMAAGAVVVVAINALFLFWANNIFP